MVKNSWDEWEDAPKAEAGKSNSHDDIDPLGLLDNSGERSAPKRPGVDKGENSTPKRPQLKRPALPVEKDNTGEVSEDEGWGVDVPAAGSPIVEVDTPAVKDNVVWVEAGSRVPLVEGSVENDFEDDEDYDEDDFDEDGGEALSVFGSSSEGKKVKGDGSRKGGGNGKKKPLGGIRLTVRDKEILEFLGRYRYATVAQLSRRFDVGEKTLRNRLPKLREAGLVDSVFVVHARPQVWLVTSTGLSAIGMNLTAPTIRWGQVRHTMWLTDLGIAFETAGENVLTEREVRAAATRYSPTPRMQASVDFYKTMELMDDLEDDDSEMDIRVLTALTVPVPGRGIGHIPDMVLARQPFPNGVSGSIAVELELTRKNLGEWRTVLTAFRDSDRFSEVYYYVTSTEVARAMKRVVKALNAEDKIHIVKFEPVDETARMFTGSE